MMLCKITNGQVCHVQVITIHKAILAGRACPFLGEFHMFSTLKPQTIVVPMVSFAELRHVND